jgi:hypothetical protein
VAGGWTRLHNEELRNLYASENISRFIEWRGLGGWDMLHAWGDEKCLKNSVRKREGRWPLERRRREWEDSIEINLKEIGYEVVGWIHLSQDRVQLRRPVNVVMDLQVPWKAGNLTSWTQQKKSPLNIRSPSLIRARNPRFRATWIYEGIRPLRHQRQLSHFSSEKCEEKGFYVPVPLQQGDTCLS